jgi:hypothetical protein
MLQGITSHLLKAPYIYLVPLTEQALPLCRVKVFKICEVKQSGEMKIINCIR